MEIPGAAPGLSAGRGGGAGWVRAGAALGEHAASAPQAEEAPGNESASPGRPRCTRADSVGGRCLRGDFPLRISPHPFSFRFHAPAAPCHNRLAQGDAPPFAGPLRPERLTLGSYHLWEGEGKKRRRRGSRSPKEPSSFIQESTDHLRGLRRPRIGDESNLHSVSC